MSALLAIASVIAVVLLLRETNQLRHDVDLLKTRIDRDTARLQSLELLLVRSGLLPTRGKSGDPELPAAAETPGATSQPAAKPSYRPVPFARPTTPAEPTPRPLPQTGATPSAPTPESRPEQRPAAAKPAEPESRPAQRPAAAAPPTEPESLPSPRAAEPPPTAPAAKPIPGPAVERPSEPLEPAKPAEPVKPPRPSEQRAAAVAVSRPPAASAAQRGSKPSRSPTARATAQRAVATSAPTGGVSTADRTPTGLFGGFDVRDRLSQLLGGDGGGGLEEQLGARLPIWIGSLALLLAGVFLVKYTFDAGLIGPTARVLLGTAFGLLLIGGAEKLRASAEAVAGGLAAAGVGVLFASFLAASNVFGLVSPAVGFVLLAATAIAAVVLSLRFGALVAVLGLIGGYMTPLLLQTGGEPHPAPLFGYLLLLQTALLAVTQRRSWWRLAGLALTASMLWVVLWLSGSFEPAHSTWLGFFLVASAASFLSAGIWGGSSDDEGKEPVPLTLGRIALVASLVLLAAVTVSSGYRTIDWAYLWLLGAGCIALGRLRPEYERLPWLTAALTAVLLTPIPLFSNSFTPLTEAPGPLGIPQYLWIVMASGALYAVGSYLSVFGAKRPASWAALAAASSVVFTLVGYVGMGMTDAYPWGAAALVAGLIAAAGAAVLARRRESIPDGNLALAYVTAAAAALFALAVALELPREWMAVAWSLEAFAIAWIAHRLQVPQIRVLVWPLAAAVGVRLLLNPFVLTYPIGTTPVFNWLLYGYGVPIAALGAAAWLACADGDDRLSRALQWLTVALGFVMVTLQVRQVFNPDHLAALDLGFVERASYSVAWLAYGLALLLADRRWPVRSLGLAGLLSSVVGAGWALVVNGLLTNPVVTGQPVGELPLLNWLLWAFGLPAALAVGAAWIERDDERVPERDLASISLGLGLILILAFVVLEVRQLFNGGVLSAAPVGMAELGAYGVALLALSLAFLRADRYWPRRELIAFGEIAAALAWVPSVAATRVAFDVDPVAAGIGPWPVVNWLVWLFAVPAGLYVMVARQMDSKPAIPAWLGQAARLIGLALLWLFLTAEVRHFWAWAAAAVPRIFDDAARQDTRLIRWAGYVNIWLVYGSVLLWLRDRSAKVEVRAFAWGVVLVALAASMVATVAANPWLTGDWVGRLPLLNWLLWVYLLPAALAVRIAWFEREPGSSVHDLLVTTALGAGLVLIMTLVTLEVRQLFHGEYLSGEPVGFVELGTYAIAWLAVSLAFLRAESLWPRREFPLFGGLTGGTALLVSVVGLLWAANPVLTGASVGHWPIVNWLLWAYGVPAALAIALSRELERRPDVPRWASAVPGLVSLLLMFALVTLEVRQLFHGDVLTGSTTKAELWAYSLSWVLFGLALLVAGIVRRTQPARYASLAVMMLAVAKVFLYDTGNVGDVFRVLSYLGLGLSLLLLAWLYQRFVFVTGLADEAETKA